MKNVLHNRNFEVGIHESTRGTKDPALVDLSKAFDDMNHELLLIAKLGA